MKLHVSPLFAHKLQKETTNIMMTTTTTNLTQQVSSSNLVDLLLVQIISNSQNPKNYEQLEALKVHLNCSQAESPPVYGWLYVRGMRSGVSP